MVQQLWGDIEKLKAEVRRLRGELRQIAAGSSIIGTITTGGGGSGSSTPTPVSGAIMYGTAVPAWARLPIGSTGEVLTVVSGFPSWEPGAGFGYVPFGSGSESFSP